MRYILLSQYEKAFKRTPFQAVENISALSADEQRWFVYQLRVKDDPALVISAVEEWTSKELGDAVGVFFDVSIPSIPSSQTSTEPLGS